MFELGAATTEAELVAPHRPNRATFISEWRRPWLAAQAPRSTVLQALIHEIRVDSRQAIHPVFPVPVGGSHQQDDAARALSRSVDLGSHNTNRLVVIDGPTFALAG